MRIKVGALKRMINEAMDAGSRVNIDPEAKATPAVMRVVRAFKKANPKDDAWSSLSARKLRNGAEVTAFLEGMIKVRRRAPVSVMQSVGGDYLIPQKHGYDEEDEEWDRMSLVADIKDNGMVTLTFYHGRGDGKVIYEGRGFGKKAQEALSFKVWNFQKLRQKIDEYDDA